MYTPRSNTALVDKPGNSETRHLRILLDCTETVRLRANTGIQRTVRSIADIAINLDEPSFTCLPIVFDGNSFVHLEVDALPGPIKADEARVPLRERLRRWVTTGSRVAALRASLLHPEVLRRVRQAVSRLSWSARSLRRSRKPAPKKIEYSASDWIVLLDSNWGPDLRPELTRAKDAGARVCVLIYDLIQIRHPELVSPGAGEIYQRWFERTIPFANRIVTISRAVRDDVVRYLQQSRLRAPSADRIGWFHLGSDFDPATHQGSPSARMLEIFGEGFSPTFLVVGTLEQRKSQATVLDAFERRWNAGDPARLIIVGREGWGSHALTRRLRLHGELGKRLIWLEHADDADLEACYRHAAGLIIASTQEGFGLPIVEALQRGIPVIASDIPVFREVGGDDVNYFAPGDVDALASAIASADRHRLQWPTSGRLRAQSWHESTMALIAQLQDVDQ